jgi:hypothetical protein
MTSLNFWHFVTPSPYRHAFYYWDLSTVVTKSLTSSDRDVIYGRPINQVRETLVQTLFQIS